MVASPLATRITTRLIGEITAGSLPPGQHVGAQQVADRYGVSRTPVREALAALEEAGVLVRQANRGFFVAETLPEGLLESLPSEPDADSADYQRLADDWLTDKLPEEVTEQHLRQTYGWTKSHVADLLVRAAREGWAERKEGYGWRFLPVAKTPEAFDEIYRFRMAIEPVAMLEPSFELDREVLSQQRRIQENMLEIDINSVPAEHLLQSGALFHEEIIKLSRNPFFLMALQRVNRMRRLMEYRAEVNRDRLVEQCSEHLDILALLERGEVVDASYLMRQHLSGALKRKSPLAWNWAADSGPASGETRR
ncbi:GntR family transcriptional regulator [Pseudoruegeria sp. SHC-113]|uniref:GntR family transcriptional regulator n=1 Tax=Pseudoruegeria sp. SHC-113 TaxID=2855439 RepID=UPI0021BAADD3|nr:GntR family transcriptional regulator [Pseudoruegeria sp. SHC-113]MCT8161623.1 GntR family transcriptional regulator [Pseudoruegeria sp. SHC-113]